MILFLKNLCFQKKHDRLQKVASVNWYSFFRPSTFANRLIKIGLDGGAEDLQGMAIEGETLGATDIENLVEALEKDAPVAVEVFDEIYKGIEKTYAVPV